jgi:hypothetical protein
MKAIKLGDELQEKTEASLKRTMRLAVEAEQMATNSLNTMAEHEQRIAQMGENMDDVMNNLQEARKVS